MLTLDVLPAVRTLDLRRTFSSSGSGYSVDAFPGAASLVRKTIALSGTSRTVPSRGRCIRRVERVLVSSGSSSERSHDRWGEVPAAGHAVDGRSAEVADVYAALYTELAERWVERGVSVHDVELPAVEAIEEAWHLLGFGRRVCIGSRPTLVSRPATRS